MSVLTGMQPAGQQGVWIQTRHLIRLHAHLLQCALQCALLKSIEQIRAATRVLSTYKNLRQGNGLRLLTQPFANDAAPVAGLKLNPGKTEL